jgi:DNA polymerase III subunit delta
MSVEKILSAWRKKQFKPVYWLEGEEDFFIDQLTQYAEQHILSEAEAGFNLTVFYGRDAIWSDVVNACMRYPMFSEKQVVLLKEAQQFKELDRLEPYISKPLASTIFIVAHKEKKVDGRSKLAKVLKDKAEVYTTKKIHDNQLPEWAADLIQSKGLSINQRALHLLVEHIGNDLSRISNEVNKLMLNLGSRKQITENDIEEFIGISKDYNAFELQNAFGRKDLARALTIIQYFEHNPKAGPIQLLLPVLYNFFSKLYVLLSLPSRDEKTVAAAIGVSPFFVRDYLGAANKFSFESVEKILLLLDHYNLRSVGVNDVGTSHASLMKEMAVKMIG